MVPRSTNLPKGGNCISSCYPHCFILPSHTDTLPLFIHKPGYVSWLVIPGLMCIHASWCVFSHHLLALQRRHPLWSHPLPLSSSSSLCFPLHMFQWKKSGICQNLSFLPSGLSTISFFVLFFFFRWDATEIHSALTPQWFLKCQNRWMLKCCFFPPDSIYVFTSEFSVFTSMQCF